MVFVFMAMSSFSIAQLNPRSTLYSYHQSSYNPAICGAFDYGNATAVIRKQYIGFVDGAGPATTWFDVSMPLKRYKSGVGLSVAQTKEGFEKRVSAKLNYSYQLELGAGRLGMGLSAGLNSVKWDLSEAIYPDGSSDSFLDTELSSDESYNNLLLGFGLYYQVGGLYAALAVTELNQPALKVETGKLDYLKRHYWLACGYEYRTPSPMWVLYPSMTIKTTFADLQASFDCQAIYNNFVIAGISYASSHDISLNVGAQFKNGSKLDGLRAIISYDIVTSKLGGESAGNLEFMLSYDFNLFVEKENKMYKSVRFL